MTGSETRVRAQPDRDSATDRAPGESGVDYFPSDSKVHAVAMLVVGLAAGAAIVVLPGVLSAFVAAGEVTAPQSSRIGAFELGGITIFMFGSGFLLNKFDRRRIAFFSVLAIVIGQSISAWPHSIEFLSVTRLCVGLAEGVLIATVTAAIASSASPERLFALWFSMNLVMSAAFFAALPQLLSMGQVKGVMFALAGLAVIAASALPWFPRRAPVATPMVTTSGRGAAAPHDHLLPAILAMSASLILFTAIGALWPLMPQIGHASGVDVAVVTRALSAASFAGVASGLITSWLGVRLGRKTPVIVGTLGLSTAVISLLSTGGPIFAFAAISFMAWWIFNGTYYLGVLSALDRSGRLATLTFGIQFLGLTVGQFLSAILLQGGSYRELITVGASLSLAALLLMVMAMRSRGYRAATEHQ
jgi:predicted MFS family arabinose efflux permease